MISKSLTEYIKTMYLLEKQNGEIRVTDIANKMNCTKASVNKSVKILKENKLVNYETYGKIKLTDTGVKLAKKALEAYDISYLFLHDILNIDEEKATVEADKMKKVLQDDTINKLAKYVHKILDLYNLDCDYNINNERCIDCLRRKKPNKNMKGSN